MAPGRALLALCLCTALAAASAYAPASKCEPKVGSPIMIGGGWNPVNDGQLPKQVWAPILAELKAKHSWSCGQLPVRAIQKACYQVTAGQSYQIVVILRCWTPKFSAIKVEAEVRVPLPTTPPLPVTLTSLKVLRRNPQPAVG
ncbi:5 -methylthioadenosine phosphorylase [Micractinium conductrix]|uniref:5 -methylthioadenosine phosphorylase n=1 Tax=Micractinium conductrix TaxID=554055 RepID=A0A2P6VHS7_9CHLO|nr:5 -methylthioadenosine phosphorylase [Micractinium conductrix]|eukprot:PSC73630.1 5 -methylthioadenosine phosphorylase [Micractinium conductrix]